MWKHIFGGLYVVHALLLAVGAVGLFRFWAKTRFWLPKYVHALAGVGFAVMVWVLSMVPADAPIHQWGPISRFLFALVLPAMIYFFFIFYGGQRAAFDRAVSNQAPCPFCGNPVRAQPLKPGAVSATQFLERACNHCGQTLAN